MDYPKVLSIGQSFNKRGGGGITISNLFHDWPKEKLAVASNDNLTVDLDFSVCGNYYQLGYNNKLHPFPLNIVLPKVKCGLLTSELITINIQNTSLPKPGKYKRVYFVLQSILKFIGIYNVLYKIKITPDFTEWLLKFNPDFIYSQLSTLELINLVSDIHDIIDKPIVIPYYG